MKDTTTSVYNFEKLRREGYLYVDKTEYIWQLINPAGESYFLSRPRRFGKSLTISTLKAVFEGKKELFRGLAIYDKPYDWKPYPVIHLSFGDYNVVSDAERELPQYLMEKLRQLAQEHSVTLPDSTPGTCFGALIDKLAERGGQVVILVDEYDKPTLDNITNPRIQEIQRCLKGFYSVLKDRNSQERFLFVTGVSKFCHVSLFSDLNNLTDITMNAKYATMLGYTQSEFEFYFADRIEQTAKLLNMPKEQLLPEIKAWYDGYRFEETAETVYNPVSLASFFGNGGKFNNYWFSTGTPSFLLELVKKTRFDFDNALTKPVSAMAFNAFEIDKIDPLTLLLQTGYLTIKSMVKKYNMPWYWLDFPNREVSFSFNTSLVNAYTRKSDNSVVNFCEQLADAMDSGDVKQLRKTMEVFFAGIPYDVHHKNESNFQNIFFALFRLLGYYIKAESQTNDGRIDAVAETEKFVFLFEFKLDKDDTALSQIKDKKYFKQYELSQKKIFLNGVAFDTESGQIADWQTEEVR
ncbi:MAG: ATP-binding protein [Lentisphaeria bacterium]|nr:ATP-binding protein [Lentisphaeria bacterium]